MLLLHIVGQFLTGLKQTTALEYIAVLSGIASVWYSKKENILVYPVGLASTTLYIYLSLRGHLFGEASVNLYYTIVSLYGWFLWTRKNKEHQLILQISFSDPKERWQQMLYFAVLYFVLFSTITFLQSYFSGAIPWADAFASATAYVGMWLMAKKKVESWWWWIATNIASIPLYFVKGFVFTSFYYLILLVLAVSGLREWKRKATATPKFAA